jgi:DNA-binding LacI/PurR family transcriptional regulator
MIPENPSQPTLGEVARRAGVSPATVSRVLNRSANVNGPTRERVLNAMFNLGLEVPPLSSVTPKAKNLQGVIALLITDILNPFFPEVVRGVEEEAAISEHALMLCNTSEDHRREQQILQMLTERQVDGIVVCASRLATKDLISLHERNDTPMVVINRRLDYPGIPCLTVDFENASYRAAQHLLRLDHRRIAYLAGQINSESSAARKRGIEMALAEHNLALPAEMCPNSYPSIEGGFQAMSSLLTLPKAERPTAVLAYNDVMALGALHAIRTYRLSVPEDISVIGFDGVAMAAHSNPPLTTIEQPKYRMGKLAMQMLRQLIQGQPTLSSGYTLMESPLVVRESTSPYHGG